MIYLGKLVMLGCVTHHLRTYKSLYVMSLPLPYPIHAVNIDVYLLCVSVWGLKLKQ